jgi:hypothetical protein
MTKKAAHNFILRIAEGMAGWGSFIQAAKRSPVYSEHLMYMPMFELATNRGWSTRPQKKLSKEKERPGRYSTIDFAFRSPDESIGILVEMKFDKYNTVHCLGITKDIYKLSKLSSGDIWKEPPKELYKFVLIMGRDKKIIERTASLAKPFSKLTLKNLNRFEDERLLKQMRQALRCVTRSINANPGWAIPGIGNDKYKNWVLLLREESWWKSLRTLRMSNKEKRSQRS